MIPTINMGSKSMIQPCPTRLKTSFDGLWCFSFGRGSGPPSPKSAVVSLMLLSSRLCVWVAWVVLPLVGYYELLIIFRFALCGDMAKHIHFIMAFCAELTPYAMTRPGKMSEISSCATE